MTLSAIFVPSMKIRGGGGGTWPPAANTHANLNPRAKPNSYPNAKP